MKARNLQIFFISFLITLVTVTQALADPVLINLSPNRGRIGSYITMTARFLDVSNRDNNQVFINGVIAPVVRVYAVAGSENLAKLLFTVPPNVVDEPISSPQTVPVFVKVNGVRSDSLDFTLLPSPMLTTIHPDSGNRGDSLDVEIAAVNTRFIPRRTRVDFGNGITVSAVNVTGPTSLTATIQIAEDAQLGPRDITVRAGRARLRKIGGFTVSAPVGQGQGLNLTVHPVPSPVFTSHVTISGVVNGAGSSVNATGPGQPAIVTQILPASGAQGTTLLVSLKGSNTHFTQDVTQLSFGPGIEVLEANVTSPEELTARIKIDPEAASGERRVIAVTNTEEAISVVTFNVLPGSMTITGVITDESGNPLQGAEISIKGFNIHTTSNAQGIFSLTNVPSGKQTLIVNAPNFAAVEIEISGENGKTIDFTSAGISLERKAAPPGSQSSNNLFSLLSEGENRLTPPNGIEKAKELIVRSIITLMQDKLGIISDNGTQLNPAVSGEAILSINMKGIDNLAKEWVLQGKVYSLADFFSFANVIVRWHPNAPDFYHWLRAFQEVVNAAWTNPNDQEYALFLACFNKGSVLSDSPPKIRAETKLNPLQMFLLVNRFAIKLYKYIPEENNNVGYNHSSMVAEVDTKYRPSISDITPKSTWIIVADNNNDNNGTNTQDIKIDNEGTKQFLNDFFNNTQGALIATVGDYDSIIELSINGIGLLNDTTFVVGGLGNFLTNLLDNMIGSVFQQIYKPLLNYELLLKAKRPTPPEVVDCRVLREPAGLKVQIKFKPSNNDRGQISYPRFYYSIYRIDKDGNKIKTVKPSNKFDRDKNGNLIFIDDSPPSGAVRYYLQSHVRRQESVPTAPKTWNDTLLNTWWNALTSLYPYGNFVLNFMIDMFDSIYEMYMGLILQHGALVGPVSIIVSETPSTVPSLEIAVDHFHKREYFNMGGYIYASGYDSEGWKFDWTPFIKVWTNPPYPKGLTLDSAGNLYIENAASEGKFGGRIWGFRTPYKADPYTNITRFYLGSVNYYSYSIFYAKPVSITDMYDGFFRKFYLSSLGPWDGDSESIAILESASQSLKLLDRNHGRETPLGQEGAHHVAVTLKKFNSIEITPYSKLAQNPYFFDSYYYVSSHNNIVFFSEKDPSTPYFLFDPNNVRFSMISDFIFDDDGNLYFLDKNLGQLFMVPGQIVNDRCKKLNNQSYIDIKDVFLVAQNYVAPVSIEFGAEYKTILVADMKGLHRIKRLIPYCIDSSVQNIIQHSVVLLKTIDGTSQVPVRGHYLFIPADGPSSRDNFFPQLIIRLMESNDADHIVNLLPDECLNFEPWIDLPSEPADNITIEETNSTQRLQIRISEDAAGKTLYRNILIPVSKFVKKGHTSTLIPAQISDQIEIPSGKKLSPIIVFSPLKVSTSTSQTVAITAIITDSEIQQIHVETDSEDLGTVQAENQRLQIEFSPHIHRNIITFQPASAASTETVKTSISVFGQDQVNTTTLTGLLLDNETKMPLRNMRIYIPELKQEVITNHNGFYQIEVPVGRKITLEVSPK